MAVAILVARRCGYGMVSPTEHMWALSLRTTQGYSGDETAVVRGRASMAAPAGASELGEKSQNPDIPNSLGPRLRNLRCDRGLTQEDLAAKSGLSRVHISNIERGAALPGRNALDAITATFGVTMEYLLTGADLSVQVERGRVIIESVRKLH